MDVGEYQSAVLEHKDRVYSFAVHLLRDPEEGRDVAQEALVRLYTHREAVVPEAYVGPSVAPTIDIVGEPGSYVPALAPMPSNEAPVKKAPKSTTAKARGLRRLISAIKRGA